MATLPPYYGEGTATGTKVTIYDDMSVIGYQKVGSGEFVAFSTFSAQFKGTVEVEGSIGSLISLTDEDPSAITGPCSVEINGHADQNATYAVESNKLVISYGDGGTKTYTLWQEGSDTRVRAEGHDLKFQQ